MIPKFTGDDEQDLTEVTPEPLADDEEEIL